MNAIYNNDENCNNDGLYTSLGHWTKSYAFSSPVKPQGRAGKESLSASGCE